MIKVKCDNVYEKMVVLKAKISTMMTMNYGRRAVLGYMMQQVFIHTHSRNSDLANSFDNCQKPRPALGPGPSTVEQPKSRRQRDENGMGDHEPVPTNHTQ